MIFSILEFCFHETTLQAYLACSVCAMDMVDSALKRLDLVLLKHHKSFGKHDEKNVSATGKKGPVYWSLGDLKKNTAFGEQKL